VSPTRELAGARLDPRPGTAERILDEAEALFAERGYAGAAMRDIAARVGVNPASIYNHFPGKRELYEAVLDRGLQPILEQLGQLLGSEWSAGRDERVIEALVDHFGQKPNFARLLHHEALTGGESLARLGERWLTPIYARGVAVLHATPTVAGRSADELSLLVLALHNLVLCYFSMAPLFERLLGRDLLGAEALDRQKRFLRGAIRRLLAA